MARIYSLNPGIDLHQVIPESIYVNSANFVEFMRAYYEWMHTSDFYYVSVSGTFIKGEIVIGQISKSAATINYIKSDNVLVCFISGTRPFETGENIVGQTSGAVGRLTSIDDNILRKTDKLIDYKDVDKSIDKFSSYLKDDLYSNIPSSYDGDKRNLAKRIRDFYEAKGQEEAYRFFMKTLYGQDIELLYPSKEILRVSDGKFSKQTVIRAALIGGNSSDEIFKFLFKTIRGRTSESIANVIDIKKLFIGTTYVAEMTLSLSSGTFIEGETIYDVVDETIAPLETTIYGIVSDYVINNGGSGYFPGDELTVIGDGEQATMRVSETYVSPIDKILVTTVGHGYRVGTEAVVDNTGTGGSGLRIIVSEIKNPYTVSYLSDTYTVGEISKVQIVNKGSNYAKEPTILLRDDAVYNIGLTTDKYIEITNTGTDYTVGDWLTITPTLGIGSGANAVISSVSPDPLYADSYASFLMESDDAIIEEQNGDTLKQENWYNRGPIARITSTSFGSGYNSNSFPFTITVNNSTANTGNGAVLTMTNLQGAGANVIVDTANNSGGIGSIKRINIVNFGVDYTTATVSTVGVGNENANITAIIDGSATYTGDYINDDGKLDYKKIQDSYYYQQYSYVIRSGIEISKYKDVLKRLLHPAGLEVFGEIQILNQLNLRIDQYESLSDIAKILIYTPGVSMAVQNFIEYDDESLILYGDLLISAYANDQIQSLANTTFLTYYNYESIATYYKIEKNIKINGTADVYVSNNTIIGTNTNFTTYFSSGNSVVVTSSTSNDKFDILSVIDDTTMTIVVPPSANVVNANLYYTTVQ